MRLMSPCFLFSVEKPRSLWKLDAYLEVFGQFGLRSLGLFKC